jgi:hypothetical protein
MPQEDQLYEKRLSVAYWFVTHKFLLKNTLIIFLIVINIALFSFDLYSLINNLFIERKNYQAQVASLINANPDYTALRQFRLPAALQISNLRTLPNAKGFDILVDLNNPNTKWATTFDYQFKIGDKMTTIKRGFILPSESKTIFNLAVENGNLASELVLSNVVWNKEINFPALYKERFKFDISNIKFIPSSELGVGEKLSISRVQFDVANLSAYNYTNVNFNIFLNSANQVVALNQISSGNLLSGMTKSLEVTFFQRLPRVDGVKVVPEVNILDPRVFLKF